MSKQLFEIGQGINVNSTELECVSVGYQETDGEKHDFVYQFRLADEVKAEREAAEKAEAEAEQQRKDARAALEARNAEGTPQS